MSQDQLEGRSSVEERLVFPGSLAELVSRRLEPLPPSVRQLAEAASVQGRQVDLELVLAVDVSSSVSDEEFHLQMTGLSAAFRHPLVVAAISQSGDWGVAVAVVQWASGDEQGLSVDWSRIVEIDR